MTDRIVFDKTFRIPFYIESKSEKGVKLTDLSAKTLPGAYQEAVLRGFNPQTWRNFNDHNEMQIPDAIKHKM
jgi:hypothetical protein